MNNMVQPVLEAMYLDELECSDMECHFLSACSQVNKLGTELHFTISAEADDYVSISINIEDYLIDGRT